MPFEFNGDKIRTLTDKKGEPWFVAKVEQIDFEKFIIDCFIPDPTNNERARDIYQGWCLQNKCEARTIQWVGIQLRKQSYDKSKCPPNGVACWHGFR